MSIHDVDPEWIREASKASEFVSLMDADDRLLYVNHPQPGAEDYAGRSVFDFVDARFHEALRTCVARARTIGCPQHFNSEAQGPNREVSTYSNWVFVLGNQAGRDLIGFVASDTTQKQRMEAALELSDRTLRSLIDNAPDTILIIDRERRIRFYNHSELFTAQQVLGAQAESFVPENERPKVIASIEKVVMTGQPTSYETRIEVPDATYHYTTRLVPIVHDGVIDRVMMVATDITEQLRIAAERRQLEEQVNQASKMEALGQLTGGVAHDFNNLLTAIVGNIELAQMADDRRQIDDLLSHARQAVHRASDLTHRLLAFSRKQALLPQSVHATDLLAGMQNLLQRTLGETVDVQVEVDDSLWRCYVDPRQLENAILNLAVNARDAMPKGGAIVIRAANVSVRDDRGGALPSGEFVHIQVEDMGVGMSDEVAAQACEPFFTTKDVGAGSGLGLSMVHGFVHQSGGHIEIDSELGTGTSVAIYLPRNDVEVPRSKLHRNSSDVPRGNRELVLVVEDDLAVRAVTARVLEEYGYRTLVADHADGALKHLEAEPDIALLLSDVVLPVGVDGFEIANQARSKRGDLPVLFVSGYPEYARRSHGDLANLAGVEPPIQKPFTAEQLARAVHRAINSSCDGNRS